MGRSARRAVLYGALVGFAAVAVREAVRPRGDSVTLVDWGRVHDIAESRLRSSGEKTRDLPAARAEYRRLAAELAPPLLAFVGGLPRGAVLPAFEALDHQGWLDLNLSIIRRMVDPAIATSRVPDSLATQLGRAGVDRYIGYTLGLVGRRVLGQYDPRLLGGEASAASGLYLVEPNVEAWRLRAGLPQQDLRRWLILHELTHAWQFAAHPWLRAHMERALQTLLDSVAPTSNSLARLAAFAGVLPAQWRVLREVQAAMSVIEGYSNLVMNQLGAELLPGFHRLEQAYLERSSGTNPLDTLIWKLTGLDLKLQQYRNGEAFCRAVFDRHGIDTLNLVWTGPGSLPDLRELGDPDAWQRRVSRPPAASRGALPAPSPR